MYVTLVACWLGVVLGWVAWWGYCYMVIFFFFFFFNVAVWHVGGLPPPLKMGISSLVLNAFGVGFLASLLKRTRKGAKSDNFTLEGSSLIICPKCSLYMSLINCGSLNQN